MSSGKVVAGSASRGTIGGASPYARGAAAAESSNSGSDGIEQTPSVVFHADAPPAGVTSPGRALESDAVGSSTPAPARDGTHDPVNRPAHYTAHSSGVECIEISEHLCANLAQALQYVWRAPYKGRMQEDLAKARWFIVRECARRNRLTGSFLPTLDRDLHSRFMRAINAEGQSTFGEFLSHIRRAHFGPSYECEPLHCALDELTIMVTPDLRWWA